jgi:hypothetical protein
MLRDVPSLPRYEWRVHVKYGSVEWRRAALDAREKYEKQLRSTGVHVPGLLRHARNNRSPASLSRAPDKLHMSFIIKHVTDAFETLRTLPDARCVR